MAGKKRKDRSQGAGSADVKRLHRKLRKAEAGLAAALEKQERAGARVAAMTIIVDEMRARLATVEQAAAREADSPRADSPRVDSPRADSPQATESAAPAPAAPRPTPLKVPRRAATSRPREPASRRGAPATRRRPSPPADPT